MGVNDEAQLGTGFYKLNPGLLSYDGQIRTLKLSCCPKGNLRCLRFYSGPKELNRRVTGNITVAGTENRSTWQPGMGRPSFQYHR